MDAERDGVDGGRGCGEGGDDGGSSSGGGGGGRSSAEKRGSGMVLCASCKAREHVPSSDSLFASTIFIFDCRVG